jgi:hypothetical protein
MRELSKQEIDSDPRLVRAYNMGYHTGLKAIQDTVVEFELRDSFAAAALTGMLASSARFEAVDGSGRLLECKTDFCKLAYSFADKMIEVRNHSSPQTRPLDPSRAGGPQEAQAPEEAQAQPEADSVQECFQSPRRQPIEVIPAPVHGLPSDDSRRGLPAATPAEPDARGNGIRGTSGPAPHPLRDREDRAEWRSLRSLGCVVAEMESCDRARWICSSSPRTIRLRTVDVVGSNTRDESRTVSERRRVQWKGRAAHQGNAGIVLRQQWRYAINERAFPAIPISGSWPVHKNQPKT